MPNRPCGMTLGLEFAPRLVIDSATEDRMIVLGIVIDPFIHAATSQSGG